MPHYASQHEDVFSSSSHSLFLSPHLATLKKSPSSRHLANGRRSSSASLRSVVTSLADEGSPFTGLPNGNANINGIGTGATTTTGGGGGTNGNANGSRHHSLAHELAVALMPEPSVGSKLLAEEFGIEYDEGAEGIDPLPSHHQIHSHGHDDDNVGSGGGGSGNEIDTEFGNGTLDGDVPNSLTSQFGGAGVGSGGSEDDASSYQDGPSPMTIEDGDFSNQYPHHHHESLDDPVYDSPTFSRKGDYTKKPEQDALEVLSQDLESMDKFLHHLRSIDLEPSPSSSSSSSSTTAIGFNTSASSSASQQISLEKVASDFIRRITDTVRDREGQVRELSQCEREFRKIAGEVGGTEVLGCLDEITGIEELSDSGTTSQQQQQQPADKTDGGSSSNKPSLYPVMEEEPPSPITPRHRRRHRRNLSTDWELDPDRNHLGDEPDEDFYEELLEDGENDPFAEATSPVKDAFPRAPPPPPLIGPITPAKTVPQLTHLRTSTSSLVSQLTTLSEHAQVNGAATAEAGRKIRALKNKLGGWRMEWDSAERSRQRIERWEAGMLLDGDSQPHSPERTPVTTKRVDGRVIVQEHLRAFELALADAALKTQAIMAIIAR